MDDSYGHLKAGITYQVAATFKDFDQQVHPVGERWEFQGSTFLPYDDGLSLFATIDGHDRQVRLQHHPEEQGEIIRNLEQYLVRCK
jgi:hypothetical protein